MKRVLVVEDEPGIALALEADLTMEGYVVEIAADGESASCRAREGQFDLAVGAHRSARTALLLALARIPLRVGFDANLFSRLYHHRVRDEPARHAGRLCSRNATRGGT